MAPRQAPRPAEASTSSPGMEPGVEARIREAVAALEAAGATVEEVSLPHTDYGLATYYIVAPGGGVGEPRPLRRGPLRPAAAATATTSRTTSRRAASGFGPEVKRRIMLGTYALSAGYYDAFYLKAQKVRTLIKRDFDDAVGAGLRRARRADVADGRVPVRRADGRPGRDVPLGRLHAAGEHGRACPAISVPCGLSEGLPVGLQLIGAAWSEARAVRARPRLRGDDRRRRLARPSTPARPRDAPADPADARRRPSASPRLARCVAQRR